LREQFRCQKPCDKNNFFNTCFLKGINTYLHFFNNKFSSFFKAVIDNKGERCHLNFPSVFFNTSSVTNKAEGNQIKAVNEINNRNTYKEYKSESIIQGNFIKQTNKNDKRNYNYYQMAVSMNKKIPKRESKYTRMVRNIKSRNGTGFSKEDVIRILFVPLLPLLAFYIWNIFSEHNFSPFTFIKNLTVFGLKDDQHLICLCSLLLGLIQLVVGLAALLLVSLLTKNKPLYKLYPEKYAVRIECRYRYWDSFSWICCCLMPAIIPAIILIKYLSFKILLIWLIPYLFFTSAIQWEEIWEDKICSKDSAEMYLTLFQNTRKT